MKSLINNSDRLVLFTNNDFVRYLYNKIAWNNRFIAIVGAKGKGKSNSQIKNVENAYIAADNIENGFGNKIPLWLFGFLY